MNKKDFSFELPEELIAQEPLKNRSSSRLLVLDKNTGQIEHKYFTDILEYLKKDDCLVINDTKVIPARLLGFKKDSQTHIEILLLNRRDKNIWEVIVRPGKKLKPNTTVVFGNGELEANILEVIEGGNRLIEFKYSGIFEEVLDRLGEMPLPPYITKKLVDKNRYQTVYAQNEGSAAAPTAGLHFTPELLEKIKDKGVKIAHVTLHVGLGTFRPVKVENILEHEMHSEFYILDQEQASIINETKRNGNRIISVGTTSTRTLESCATENGFVIAQSGWTNIFIYPGYKFKVVDELITNFHLPESTLIMLVSAMAGKENILNAYNTAINEKYRFFSFGDAMFIKESFNYSNAIEYIENIGTFGSIPRLEHMETLLKHLGNPQDKLKVIHISGTNGKGSTCIMIESILRNAGYNIGLYTSPHLQKYNERIKINNIDISDKAFANLAQKIIPECNKMVNLGEGQITIFEFITALAICYFSENEIDYVILEVGMGGKYDATNIIKSPILSVITSIGMDHMEYLGDNIEEIALEKGGIIKKNSPTVLYFQSVYVYNVIEQICLQKNSNLYYCNTMEINIKCENLYNTVFSIKTNYYEYNNIILNMIGEYQIYNAATTLLAIEALKDIGLTILNKNVLKGLEDAYWQGRMELVSENPYIILDGAHNVDGITMLCEYIKKHFTNKNITFVIGVLKDKEYKKMLDMIIPLANNIIITEPISSRALSLEIFETIVSKSIYKQKAIYKEKDIAKAFNIAQEITKPDEVIICVGSLYLIGALKKIFFRRRNKND